MADTETAQQRPADPAPVPELGPPADGADTGVIVTRHRDVCSVLSDPGYEIPGVTGTAPVGTVAWLRGSVSRFANGEAHARRRAIAIREADALSPAMLRADALRRALTILDAAAGVGRIDVMAALARRVPLATLAAALGIADADRAAELAMTTAAAYFPGADAERERAGDESTAELVRLLGPADQEVIAARIAVMMQACDATAALIGTAVCAVLPPGAGDDPAAATDAIVAEVARLNPPARGLRRIAVADTEVDGCPVQAGHLVVLRLDSANRDPASFSAPEDFEPDRDESPSLTFGYGLRPCPGASQALMLAAGVVQAVRDRCAAVIGPVEYPPGAAIRVPVKVEVSLR
jgi:cytochrome P450